MTLKIPKDEAITRLKMLRSMLRAGMKEVAKPQMAILSMEESKVKFSWSMDDFVKDLELVLDVGPMSMEEQLDGETMLFLSRFGLGG